MSTIYQTDGVRINVVAEIITVVTQRANGENPPWKLFLNLLRSFSAKADLHPHSTAAMIRSDYL
jgi:hypothetical protein